MRRLFTGIPVDASRVPLLVEQATALQKTHSDLRWSDPAGWHVTLQFYGMVDAPQEQQLREQLKSVKASTAEVILQGISTFERTGVLWAGVALSDDLMSLQQKVVAVGEICGFAREERPYRPHVTLGRRKGNRGRWDFKKSEGVGLELKLGTFRADEFLLYESVAGPEGSRYEVIDRFSLKG